MTTQTRPCCMIINHSLCEGRGGERRRGEGKGAEGRGSAEDSDNKVIQMMTGCYEKNKTALIQPETTNRETVVSDRYSGLGVVNSRPPAPTPAHMSLCSIPSLSRAARHCGRRQVRRKPCPSPWKCQPSPPPTDTWPGSPGI